MGFTPDSSPHTSSGSSTPTGAIVGGVVGGVAFLLLLSLLACVFLRRRMRQVRDPNHPRHKLIGSYGTAKGEGSRSSSEKERKSGAGADLLGGVVTSNDVSTGDRDVEEEGAVVGGRDR